MIEIVLDSHIEDTFLNAPRPVYVIENFEGSTLADYRQEAQRFIQKYASTMIVIVKTPQNFSRNMFALALFIESCHIENKIDCVVFKVQDYEKALDAYKPFVALTIAVKYVMRLCKEEPKSIYREFSDLGYLGLKTQHDFLNHKIILRLGEASSYQKIITTSTGEALAAVGMLKALSLANIQTAIEVEINEVLESESLDETNIINKVIDNVNPWIH